MIEIIHGDFIEIAEHLPAIDCVITDPPYGAHVHDRTTSVNTRAGRGVTKRDLGFAACSDELRAAIASVLPRRWSVVFSDVESTHLWRETFPRDHYVRALPWVRWSQPQLSGDRPPTGCEMISLFHPPAKKSWNGHGGQTHYDHAPERSKEKYTAEKPLDLMLALVSAFSDSGDLVLDPCAGWGTTAAACWWLGRSCIAIESDAAAAAVARNRVHAPSERPELALRDALRAEKWVADNIEHAREAFARKPRNKSEQPAWERAGRRLRDIETVARKAGIK